MKPIVKVILQFYVKAFCCCFNPPVAVSRFRARWKSSFHKFNFKLNTYLSYVYDTEWCGWVMGEHGRLHKINLQSSASRRVGTQNILISTDRSNPIPSIQEMNFKCNSRPTIYQFYCTMWSSYSTELCVWASLKENILRRLPIPQITVTARYNWGKTHFH